MDYDGVRTRSRYGDGSAEVTIPSGGRTDSSLVDTAMAR